MNMLIDGGELRRSEPRSQGKMSIKVPFGVTQGRVTAEFSLHKVAKFSVYWACWRGSGCSGLNLVASWLTYHQPVYD